MGMSNELANFPGLGNVILGKDDDDVVKNDWAVGGVRTFEHISTTRAPKRAVLTQQPVTGILLRNVSGSSLTGGGYLVKLSYWGSGTYDIFTEVLGKQTTANLKTSVLVDPWLQSTAVIRDDDLFWGIIKGPAPALYATGAAGCTLINIRTGVAFIGAEGHATGGVDVVAHDYSLGYGLEVAAADETKWVLWNHPLLTT